jgi:hypothetical protein
MTRHQYFEMCEMLQTEPLESEIPVEFEDLNEDVQYTISIYNMLQDNWDTMNGIYLGKSMAGISDIFNLMEVEDPKSCFFIIGIIDRVRSEIINAKKPSK